MLIATVMCVAAVTHGRTIRGTITAASDSSAVGGAACRLMAEGKMICGTTSDAEGLFSLSTETKSPLRLEITMTGFSPTEILIEEGGKNRDLGTIFLDAAVTLSEVTVTAGHSTTDIRGRTIVFPSATDISASPTSLSLFQKLPLPGLQSNPINRSLSVDGGSPVILINGIPSTIDDVNALQPKDILKIEYSRFTPARYADRGASGYLNIILKARNDGGTIYIWGRSAVNTAFVDGNVKGSYHQGPSQFTLSYNPSWRNYQSVYDYDSSSLIGDDFRVDLTSDDRNPFSYHYHPIRLKYDYTPSARTLFSATFTATPNISKRRTLATNYDNIEELYFNRNISKSTDFAPSLDLFLRHDFNDRNSIEAQLVGTLSSSDYDRDYTYYYPAASDETTSVSYLQDVRSRRRSLISEISYIHDFSDRTQLSAGFQNTVSRSTNHYILTGEKPLLTENNNYLYARLGQQAGKVYLTLSTGAKLFWIKNDIARRHFIRNLSTARANWKIDGCWNLSANFSFTPSIPSLTQLTDAPVSSTPYLITNGNPDLKVAQWTGYSLMAAFQKNKFDASLSLSCNNGHRYVINDVTYLGDGMFLSQPVNCRSYLSYRSELDMILSDFHGFGINATIGFSRYECSGEGWSHTLNSLQGSIYLWWNHGPFTLAYWRKFPGKYLSGYTVYKDENGDMLQVAYQPDKHWMLTASWMYMFDSKGTRYPSWNYSPVNPSVSDRFIRNNSNMVVLSASYSADFGSIFRTGRRSLNNSDNASSLLKM